MKGFRKSIILIVILAVAIGGYWYFEVKKKKEKEEIEKKEALLFGESDKDIVKLELKYGKDEPIIAVREEIEEVKTEKEESNENKNEEEASEESNKEKEKYRWKIISPVETAGDKDAIMLYIDKIKQSSREEVVREDLEKLEEYGLKEPNFSLRFYYEGEDKPHGVDFGIESLDRKRVFVRVLGENKIYSILKTTASGLEKTLYDLRDKRICPYEKDDIVGIGMISGLDMYHLEKKGDEWYFSDGVKASTTRVNILTGALRWGSFVEVVEEKAKDLKEFAKYGLDKPRILLSFKLKDGGSYTFILGNSVKEGGVEFYYATRSTDNMIFKVKNSTVSSIAKTKFDLKDRHIFDIAQNLVNEVTLEEKDGINFTVVKEGETWKFKDNMKTLKKDYKIDNLVRGILTAEYEKFEPIKKGDEKWKETGIDKAKYRVTFGFEDGREPLTVIFTEKDEETNRLYLSPDEGETVYYVAGYFMYNWPESREELFKED